MSKVIPIEYSIEEIKTNQFALFDSELDPTKVRKSITTEFKYGIKTEEKTLLSIIDILYSYNDSPVLKIQTQAIFKFKEDAYKSFLKGEEFVMSTEHVRFFTSLLFDSTRGILVCKLESTKFNDFILPVIDLGEIIKTPLKIKIASNLD